jgi:hypothetical protein
LETHNVNKITPETGECMSVWRGSPVVGTTNIHAKFSFNSTNNLNYKETLPEVIAGERKKETTNVFDWTVHVGNKFHFICFKCTIDQCISAKRDKDHYNPEHLEDVSVPIYNGIHCINN